MTTQVIAFDFDDVLVQFNRTFAAFHNQMYGTTRTYEELFSYEMHLVWECDPDTIIERVKRFYESQHHAELEPIPGVLEAVAKLQDVCVLDIVTSRPEVQRESTHSLLARHFPKSFRNVHFTNGFAAEGNALRRTKSAVCKEIGAIVLIEDALKHAAEVAAHGIPVLMPDRPWNREATPNGVIRVHDWDEVITWIEERA